MNLNVPIELHNNFKSVTAAQGQNMTDVLLEFIQELCRQELVPEAEGTAQVKRAALYMRVSSLDQHPETQLYDLRQMAAQRGYEIVQEYTDRISGAKARRPGLDDLMRDARRGRFDVVLVWASDRIARSVKHFLEVLDELNRLNIEFVSFREQIDTGGPLGRAIVVIIGAIAELERNLIVERVRAGMRRARLEGRHIGRRPLELDREAIFRDRQRGQSLGKIAREHRISRTTVHRVLHLQNPAELLFRKGPENRPPYPTQNNEPDLISIRLFHRVWVEKHSSLQGQEIPYSWEW